MKKLLLSLVALAATLSVSALPQDNVLRFADTKAEKGNLRSDLVMVDEAPVTFATPAATWEDIVTQRPDGELSYLCRDGKGYYKFLGYVFDDFDFSAIVTVVKDDQGNWWFKNLLPFYSTKAWIKAERVGSKLYIRGAQAIAEDVVDDSYAILFAVPMVYTVVDETRATLYPADDLTMSFTIASDGTITQDNPLCVLGIATERELADGGVTYHWQGYGGYSYSLSNPPAPATVNPPSTATVEQWPLKYGDGNGFFVNVAVTARNIYIQGLYQNMPDVWVMGIRNGRNVTFNNVCLGADYKSMRYVYMVGADVTLEWNEDYQEFDTFLDLTPNLTLDYNDETRTISSGGQAIVFNPSDKFIRPFSYLKNVVIKDPSSIVYDRPRTPYITGWYENLWEIKGVPGGLVFDLYKEDINGNLLPEDKLFWSFYVDGELYTFDFDYYYDLPGNEPTTLIPWGYYDNWDFMKPNGISHDFCFYIDAKTYGVQCVYIDGDKELRSDIAVFDMEGFLSGIGSIDNDDAEVVSETAFDLMGHEVAPGTKGLLIVRSTLSDGSVKVTKRVVR